MMSQPASVEAESADGLSILFETMVENSEALEKEQITFQGKAGDSVSLGSGLPEITDLIISLGSAGAVHSAGRCIPNLLRPPPQRDYSFIC
jgi:hypothetical protein